MLGMLALMAMTIGGADEGSCAKLTDEVAVERMIAAAEAELYVEEVYAEAESDFDVRLDEVGLAGSTLAREEARAVVDARKAWAIARNR
jgi:uncharacterized membrane protein affecting hemolysin expression